MPMAVPELTQLAGPGVQTTPELLRELPEDWDRKINRTRVTQVSKRKKSVALTGPSATPSKVLLGSLNHPILYLKAPIGLKVSRDGVSVVASNDELDEFGYGDHLTMAIEDFRQTVIELYLELERDSEQLGPEMVRVWNLLKEWVEKR